MRFSPACPRRNYGHISARTRQNGKVCVCACPLSLARWSFAALLVVFFSCLASAQNSATHTPSVKRILILNEVGASYPAIDRINRGIQATLANSPFQTEFYSEYLDTVLFPDPARQQQFRAFILRKYQDRKPDVIITVGPSSLQFMIETHKTAFPGVPIVFCMPTGRVPGDVAVDRDFTGVETDMAASETLQAALRLLPTAQHVAVVGGQGPFDKEVQAVVKQQLETFTDQIDISYLTDLAMPDLLERLKHLPTHSVVLLTTVAQDAAGNRFKSSETGPLVVRAADAPVFSLYDTFINHGEIGGDLFSFDEQGKITGSMALRVLQGEKPENMPRVKGGTIYTFDSQALRNWGLSERNLPPGSVLLNRKPTFWELYKGYAIAAALLLLAQTALILGLLWQRARRKKTEAELVASNERLQGASKKERESRERLESIITSAMDAVVAVDEDQRIVVFNAAAERMFGCRSHEAIGTPIDRFIPQRFRSTHARGVAHFGKNGNSNGTTSAARDLWALKTDGREFPIESSISYTQVGEKKLCTAIVRDVTERKQAEEARFRHTAILQSSADAIISLNLDDEVTSWNVGAQRMYGYTEDEVLGRPIFVIVPADLDQEERRLLQQARSGKTIEHYETVRLTKEGKRMDVSVTIAPLHDWTGKIVGVSGVARDITLGKQAEMALRESEGRFRLVANTAPVMIWMAGPDKLYNYFNLPWLNFTGRSLRVEIGEGWTAGVHPDDLPACLDAFDGAFLRHESFQREFRLRREDGEYRWVFDLGVPRFNPDGSLAGYIGSCIDVTERKQAEEILSTVSRRLIEAHEEERTWVARELHDDINQRLALLAVNLDVLKRELPTSTGEAMHHINDIREQIKDLGIDVQALSHRLHSSKLEYLGLAAAAAAFCREFAERKDVQIDFHTDAIPKTIRKEVSLCLFRVLQEALQNATKHSGSQHYQVSLQYAAGEEIQLTVSDFGRGFDPEESLKGRGLGITSMRERLKLVSGELSIESQTNTGAVVRARVPLLPVALSATAGKI
jgi:PAS domain S-box-containing protein